MAKKWTWRNGKVPPERSGNLSYLDDENGDIVLADHSGMKRKDALLIAAAPELLRALKACLPFVYISVTSTSAEDASDRIAHDLAEEAIAKAEGRVN